MEINEIMKELKDWKSADETRSFVLITAELLSANFCGINCQDIADNSAIIGDSEVLAATIAGAMRRNLRVRDLILDTVKEYTNKI